LRVGRQLPGGSAVCWRSWVRDAGTRRMPRRSPPTAYSRCRSRRTRRRACRHAHRLSSAMSRSWLHPLPSTGATTAGTGCRFRATTECPERSRTPARRRRSPRAKAGSGRRSHCRRGHQALKEMRAPPGLRARRVLRDLEVRRARRAPPGLRVRRAPPGLRARRVLKVRRATQVPPGLRVPLVPLALKDPREKPARPAARSRS
jgi:hypothetical protein